MKSLNLKEMEVVEGGGCNTKLAAIAFGAAAASVFFPPAAILGWAAVGAWLSVCIPGDSHH
jgi:hypothetical protein